ncbi:MAG: hypothetical protein KC643_32090 [Nitrospira sp.]|nr:hypothetical protein [Nitrospira sp.]
MTILLELPLSMILKRRMFRKRAAYAETLFSRCMSIPFLLSSFLIVFSMSQNQVGYAQDSSSPTNLPAILSLTAKEDSLQESSDYQKSLTQTPFPISSTSTEFHDVSSGQPITMKMQAVPTVKAVTGTLALRDSISISFNGFTEYLSQGNRDIGLFTLYLNHRPLKGLPVRYMSETGSLQFDLKLLESNKSQWIDLISKPFSMQKGFSFPVSVSVGYDDQPPFLSQVHHELIVIHKGWFWIFVLFLGVLLGLIFTNKGVSTLFRDPSAEHLAGKSATFSLGRTQMGFWFFLILMTYIFIWMTTGETSSLNETAITLLGLSAITGLGSVVIGEGKRSKYMEQIKEASAEEKRILEQEIAQEEDSILKDLLTDVNGYTLYRLQNLIWTLTLGVIFICHVYHSLAMPEFSETQLMLMGISGGTYLGFKFPETQGGPPSSKKDA